jgi:D-alanyl-D-alanine carboxypeptidase
MEVLVVHRLPAVLTMRRPAILLLTLLWILPADAWARQATAANLQAALDQARVRAGIIGVSAAVIGPNHVWTGASGVSDRASAIRIRPEMIFSAGSITKTFMAALTLQLVEEKALTLDDTIGQWLPDVVSNSGLRLRGTVTIRRLLNHTSGIFEYTDGPKFRAALLADLSKRWSPADILSHVQAPYFEPGAAWEYSNTNYILLGLIATRATGASVASQLQRRFFQPLGLRSTFLEGEEMVVGEIAHGHSKEFGGSKQDIWLFSRTALYSAAGSAGAIVSTSEDLARWAQALFGGGVLQPESLRQMLTFVATDDDDYDYGLGIGRQQDPTLGEMWFHSGSIPGYQAVFVYLPRSRTSIALLVNEDSVDLDQLLDALLRAGGFG